MERQAIIDALGTLGEPQDGQRWLDYSRYGVTTADASRLVSLIKDKAGEFCESEDDDYWVPLHAWRALKALMPAGLELLISGLNLVCEDEWAQDEIPEVIAAARNAAIEPLAGFIMQADNEVQARFLAIDALAQVGKTNSSLRAKAIGRLTECLQASAAAESELNGYLIAQLIDLKAADSLPVITAAFAEERVAVSISGDLEDVEIGLGVRTERSTPRPDYHAKAGDSDETDQHDAEEMPRMEPVRRETPKVGRNEPCPCGSGRKFKKCCALIS